MSLVSSPSSIPRRYLSLDLFRLPTDRFLRLAFGRKWRSALPAEGEPPFTVHAKEKSALRLVALNEAAERFGLRLGQALAEAKAMIPVLDSVEAEPEADAGLLEEIADWADRYTPLVALDGARGLMLDISGCAHLFGGEAAMLGDLLSRLDRQGFAARAAIADTPGAAYAAARFSAVAVVPQGAGEAMLDPLPVAALRLDPAVVFALERVGLKTVAKIRQAARSPLAARFGALLLRRLDQALGLEDEAISPRRPAPLLLAERRFAEPISEEEDVRAVLASLAVSLAKGLEERGAGARILELALYRVDGAVSRLAVGTSRPVRAPRLVSDLFREKFAGLAEALDAGYGFDMARLSALATEPAPPAQVDIDGRREGEADLARLVDRIGARLGLARVSRMLPRDSHWPERASALAPAALTEEEAAEWPAPAAEEPVARPLRLFHRPEPIRVIAEVPDGPPAFFDWRKVSYRVARAEGPERFSPEWWRPGENSLSRDYFRIEDTEGHRFWIFREGLYGTETQSPNWFMHGLFA